MKRYRPYIPVMIFSVGFILAFIVTVNHQWLYGGYEGLLYHSLEPLFNKGNLSVGGQATLLPGQVTLSPVSDGDLTEVMAMDFGFEGSYDRENEKGRIDIEVQSPNGGKSVPVASLVRSGDSLQLIPENGEAELVDLSGLLMEENSTKNMDVLWTEMYSRMTVTEIEAMDKRTGGGHLPKEMVAYRLDLMTALSEKEYTELTAIIGDISALPVFVTFLVDHQGTLASVELETSFAGMGVSGYGTVESD